MVYSEGIIMEEKNIKVLVIVPAYNEEESIKNVVDSVIEQDVDVVVINDGSKDKTSENAKKLRQL